MLLYFGSGRKTATKQCCTEPKPFKAFHSKGPKLLGGNGIRTADLNGTNGYSILYDIMQKEF
mgnify:CR=1 FL=1